MRKYSAKDKWSVRVYQYGGLIGTYWFSTKTEAVSYAKHLRKDRKVLGLTAKERGIRVVKRIKRRK